MPSTPSFVVCTPVGVRERCRLPAAPPVWTFHHRFASRVQSRPEHCGSVTTANSTTWNERSGGRVPDLQKRSRSGGSRGEPEPPDTRPATSAVLAPAQTLDSWASRWRVVEWTGSLSKRGRTWVPKVATASSQISIGIDDESIPKASWSARAIERFAGTGADEALDRPGRLLGVAHGDEAVGDHRVDA